MSEKKVLHIYFKGNKQTITYFPGTSANEILKMVFKLFYIKDRLKHLMCNYFFQDENGAITVFSPESTPTETCLYLCFIDATLGLKQPHPSNKWGWDADWNQKHCGYDLSSDRLRISRPERTPETIERSMPILLSDRSFKTGKYEWTVIWSEPMTYHGFGLVSAECIRAGDIGKLENFGSNFMGVPWFDKTCQMGAPKVNIKLNMDKKEALINDKLYTNLPDEVYAGICFKMPNYPVPNLTAQLSII